MPRFIYSPGGGASMNMRKIVYPFGGGSSYILDSVAGAVSAWSVRLLTAAYSGPLFRVIKDSGPDELDIYATATGDANTAALLTFVGAGNGYITKKYDQIGTNDVTNSGNIQVVNAGALVSRNGVLAPAFPGTAQLGKSGPSGLPLGNAARTMVSVAKFDVVPNEDYLCCYGSTASTGTKYCLGGWTSTKLLANFGVGLVACAGVDTLAMRRYMHTWDQTTHKLFINGAQKTLTDNTAPTLNTVNNYLVIGNNISGSYYVTGTISENIIFSTALSTADNATLDASQATYFGT